MELANPELAFEYSTVVRNAVDVVKYIVVVDDVSFDANHAAACAKAKEVFAEKDTACNTLAQPFHDYAELGKPLILEAKLREAKLVRATKWLQDVQHYVKTAKEGLPLKDATFAEWAGHLSLIVDTFCADNAADFRKVLAHELPDVDADVKALLQKRLDLCAQKAP